MGALFVKAPTFWLGIIDACIRTLDGLQGTADLVAQLRMGHRTEDPREP